MLTCMKGLAGRIHTNLPNKDVHLLEPMDHIQALPKSFFAACSTIIEFILVGHTPPNTFSALMGREIFPLVL